MKIEYVEICIKVNGTIYPKRVFLDKECGVNYNDLFLTVDDAKLNEMFIELYHDILKREKE